MTQPQPLSAFEDQLLQCGEIQKLIAGEFSPAPEASIWAAYNGDTELVDHHSRFTTPWQRMNSICFWDGESIKNRALEQASGLFQQIEIRPTTLNSQDPVSGRDNPARRNVLNSL